MLRGEWGGVEGGEATGDSAFVTDGALFGIKPIGGHAEHVVALDADPVDDGAYNSTRLGWFGQAA